MKRLKFNSQGKLSGIDGAWNEVNSKKWSPSIKDENGNNEFDEIEEVQELRTSKSLKFLHEDEKTDNFIPVRDDSGWSLCSNGKKLDPLRFSNGKTQEDVVDEVEKLIKKGIKVVFIKGACGTGKSAIALNLARRLGRASIVVPIKSLQRQYEEDYTSDKYVLKNSGKKMKIAMITGRENHDSLINPGVSCADPFLPDTIKITEKNMQLLNDYYNKNPLIKNKSIPTLKMFRRISVAPTNPYWSPIVEASFEMPLKDARKKRYKGLLGKEFIFYHRQEGCSYYDQYQAYIDADVIIFNSAKYLIENIMDRKPETEVDIIDEADEFLDGLSAQEEINLTRLSSSFLSFSPENEIVKEKVDGIIDMIQLEEKNKRALGVDEKQIYHSSETKMDRILDLLLSSPELEVELSFDELNYGNHALEVAKKFYEFMGDTYLTYKKKEGDLVVSLVTTNLSKKFEEIVNRNKALVLMSATVHSEEVLKNIFGIKNVSIVEAETINQGTIEIKMTGQEFDCRYSNFTSKQHTREDYLRSLDFCLTKVHNPTLVHVNAFEDLPSEDEIGWYNLSKLVSKEKLLELQTGDKSGKNISLFKNKKSEILFTTKCSRGIDFPGDVCNSVVFTKYPNPNVNGTFWKVLKKTHENYFWDFYKDKAQRNFLQRLYRAVRSKHDHVYILSPDIRVLKAVQEIQRKGL